MALPLFVLPAVLPFAFLVGDWESHEETAGRDGKPEKFVLKGSNRLILEDNALQLDETFEISGKKMGNHIIMSAEANGTIHAWWFSSEMATRPLSFEGNRDGSTMTLTSKETGYRIVYTILRDGRYDAQLQMKKKDSEEYSVLTKAEYVRIKK